MASTKSAKADRPLATAQRPGSLIKSVSDIMRKDKGLSGNLDRLPMFTPGTADLTPLARPTTVGAR